MNTQNVLKTVAIAEDDPGVFPFLVAMVERAGYRMVGHVENGAAAVDLVKEKRPDMLLLDLHMPVMNGLDVLKMISPLDLTAILVITADADPQVARKAMDLGASGYLLKPCDASQIVPIMESAWHRFVTVRSLREEARALSEALETRKVLDQAKGILMEQQGYTEAQAHQALQRMSQDQGLPLKDVCRSLIQVRMVLGKSAVKKTAKTPSGGH